MDNNRGDKTALGSPGTSDLSRFNPITDISQLNHLSPGKMERIKEVISSFSYKANEYYLSLVDWDDPDDPIRRLIVPDEKELSGWGDYDACNEASNTRIQGLQHKYPDSALFLVTDNCAGYCRYCFRKRLFLKNANEVTRDFSEVYNYIANHEAITDVILSGGDPLTMSTRRLAEVLKNLAEIPHVQAVRIGSKTPAYNPARLSSDPMLQTIFREFASKRGKILYLIAHFDHPRELTAEALAELRLYRECGLILFNQCPILKGINDDSEILKELYQTLYRNGVTPYYAFQGRPVRGNEQFLVPITRAYRIFHEAIQDLSGLAKRARFVMSHASGKIEILAVDEERIYMRYHRAKNPADRQLFMVYKRDDSACWLDTLEPAGPRTSRNLERAGQMAFGFR